MSDTVLLQQPTPISFDSSPDESFLSPNTMNPMEMMTPSSVADEMPYIIPESAATSPALTPADTCGPETPASSDKKPTKKRKSWGQVLPQPKTNLPPRKRAKTEDEKEQRRVERVLRNRRAAQSSRERKRQEVEALEIRNKDLETRLLDMEKQNMMLMEKLKCMGFPTGDAITPSPSIDTLRDKAVTLSTELFGSQDAFSTPMVSNTVNPASLSPKPNASALDDVPLAQPSTETLVKEEPIAETLNVPSSPDMTQRPAVTLVSDLPCPSQEEETFQSWPVSTISSNLTQAPLAWALLSRMMLLSASAILSICQRPLTQIAISLKARCSVLPTPQVLTTIIWLVTLPKPRTSTSTTSSTCQTTASRTTDPSATSPLRTEVSTRKPTTLRIKLLRKILTSSPSLARPLLDATLAALRLVSAEQCDDQVRALRRDSTESRGVSRELINCLRALDLPRHEVLLSLAFFLQRELKKNNVQRSTDKAFELDKLSQNTQPQPKSRGEDVLVADSKHEASDWGVTDSPVQGF